MIEALIAALALAAIHLSAGRFRSLNRLPRSRWLSAAGGVAVAYVFVHLLPELARGQQVIEGSDIWLLSFLEHHAYLLALLGLACFYGLERLVKTQRQALSDDAESHTGVFWLHVGSFAIYNGLIGYLLARRTSEGTAELLLYAVAMGLHFLVNDFALQTDHKRLYNHMGRWLLTTMTLAGCAVGMVTAFSDLAVSAVTAFVGGAIVLNVLKEELPEERNSHFGAFLAGSVGYSILLLGIRAI